MAQPLKLYPFHSSLNQISKLLQRMRLTRSTLQHSLLKALPNRTQWTAPTCLLAQTFIGWLEKGAKCKAHQGSRNKWIHLTRKSLWFPKTKITDRSATLEPMVDISTKMILTEILKETGIPLLELVEPRRQCTKFLKTERMAERWTCSNCLKSQWLVAQSRGTCTTTIAALLRSALDNLMKTLMKDIYTTVKTTPGTLETNLEHRFRMQILEILSTTCVLMVAH